LKLRKSHSAKGKKYKRDKSGDARTARGSIKVCDSSIKAFRLMAGVAQGDRLRRPFVSHLFSFSCCDECLLMLRNRSLFCSSATSASRTENAWRRVRASGCPTTRTTCPAVSFDISCSSPSFNIGLDEECDWPSSWWTTAWFCTRGAGRMNFCVGGRAAW